MWVPLVDNLVHKVEPAASREQGAVWVPLVDDQVDKVEPAASRL